jgi:hypothetical protein
MGYHGTTWASMQQPGSRTPWGSPVGNCLLMVTALKESLTLARFGGGVERNRFIAPLGDADGAIKRLRPSAPASAVSAPLSRNVANDLAFQAQSAVFGWLARLRRQFRRVLSRRRPYEEAPPANACWCSFEPSSSIRQPGDGNRPPSTWVCPPTLVGGEFSKRKQRSFVGRTTDFIRPPQASPHARNTRPLRKMRRNTRGTGQFRLRMVVSVS